MLHAAAQPSMGDILVIDDDPVILTVLVRALVRHGYAVRIAISGKEGLRAILNQLPALLLLDLQMLGLDGDDLLVYVRKVYPHVPVVLITAHLERAQPLADRYGVECIAKPFDLQAILDCAQRYVQCERAVGE